jgi:pimeloyl-ACP methyl ester carboxylesterase
MARIEVNGIGVSYEVIGEGPRFAAITPGGRFSKDTPGVRELAQELAKGGFKVLIYDRPNCGESDISFNCESESFQNADTLAGLLRALNFGPALLFGGSGGARETLLAAIRHPDVVERVFILWISGGGIGIATLPITYYAESVMTALAAGMEAVADLPTWKEVTTRNPSNRDRFLAFDRDEFSLKLRALGDAFLPHPGAPIPCATVEQLKGIKVPVMVLRSGTSDPHHPRATSEAVAALIPGAQIVDPPWGDREWMDQLAATGFGQTQGLFSRWPLLAPQVLAFAG